MTRRLSKVASELNVGISTIVTFLNKKGYKIYSDPNAKVSDDIYNILIKEFSYYMAQKKRTDEIKLQKGFPQNSTYESTQIDNVQNILVSSNNDSNLSLEVKNISENELIKDNPKVFISYSWDSEEHKQWVENFARVLMSNGIITILDQYELSIGDNLQLFMEKHIPDVDKVIIILTPNYKEKAERRHGGVGYEYSIITQELFEDQNTKKYIPVQKEGELEECIPTFLKGRLFLDMRSKSQFKSGLKQIIYTVYNRRMIEKPVLGKIPDFKNLNLGS